MRLVQYRTPATLFDNLFSDFFENSMVPECKSNWPRVDIEESDDAYHLKGELPGIGKEDVKIEIDDNVLTISGEKKEKKEEEDEKNVFRRETFEGSFTRSFKLPQHVDVENVNAEFKDGLLLLTIPKDEAKKKKTISIA